MNNYSFKAEVRTLETSGEFSKKEFTDIKEYNEYINDLLRNGAVFTAHTTSESARQSGCSCGCHGCDQGCSCGCHGCDQETDSTENGIITSLNMISEAIKMLKEDYRAGKELDPVKFVNNIITAVRPISETSDDNIDQVKDQAIHLCENIVEGLEEFYNEVSNDTDNLNPVNIPGLDPETAKALVTINEKIEAKVESNGIYLKVIETFSDTIDDIINTIKEY